MTESNPKIGKKIAKKTSKFFLSFLGFLSFAIGIIGIIIPGLPTTVFMLIAAWLFSHSSPRFEKWLLGLPKLGPAIKNYRAGLGMPRQAKIFAFCSILFFSAFSAFFLISNLLIRIVVIIIALVGIWYIYFKVPTRENVLE